MKTSMQCFSNFFINFSYLTDPHCKIVVGQLDKDDGATIYGLGQARESYFFIILSLIVLMEGLAAQYTGSICFPK